MTLDLALKLIPPAVTLIIAIAGYVRLQSQVTSNTENINKVNSLLTSGDSGGAPFITDKEHDRLQLACKSSIEREIRGINADLKELKETVKEGDECRKEARAENQAQLSVLRKEFNEHYVQMAVLVAEIKADIKHLTKGSN